jgi:hypothetical protein
MLRIFYKYLLILSLGFIAINADAQRWSYVYIQGDKKIPFYVKLEGQMLPRYGKNYCIIPELGPGTIHLQILFQQNEYPPVDFNVLVPDGGHRGFLLVRKDDQFSLYDIEQRFYLLPGEEGEDQLPDVNSLTASTNRAPERVPVKEDSKKKAVPKETVTAKKTSTSKSPGPKKTNSNEPKFLDNIELDNEATDKGAPPPSRVKKPAHRTEEKNESGEEQDYRQTDAGVNLTADAQEIINSDCPEPIANSEFDKIYNSAQEKRESQKRVIYLLDKAKSNCFSTRQAYYLAKQLPTEPMRYSFLKRVYPRITDQQNFSMLEDNLFTKTEWKDYFRSINN